ncbi:hypothetical protein RM61_07265 [Xanthomonas phaseoli pv. phaseoli]|uniref:hypothetical protein n=1 Tax=Xanthomonas phaseoli TaxID=1985254 RepID=UPI00057346F2|nr:hypothetical protein [Xanthomonas phaseoli]KHS08016.1 hypothetical protein RM61_07265 [Xanthomonas phaseoli pv. phaseoli]
MATEGEPPIGDGDDFSQIGPAARATAKEADRVRTMPGSVSPAPNEARSEDYETQHTLSEVANRKWRKYAFLALGVSCLVYLLLLPFAICMVINDSTLAVLASTSKGAWQVIALIGLVLVILAAVPLSLSLTLVKMISRFGDHTDDKSSELGITTPQIEFVKALLEMFKIAQKK